MQVSLREWRLADAPAVAQYANNKKIAALLRDSFPHPYTLIHAEQLVYACVYGEQERSLYLAVLLDGKVVGSISAVRGTDIYSCAAEVGYWLAEPYWGRGVMSEAIRLISAEAFEKWPGVVRLYAEVPTHNGGSRGALKNAGYTHEATLHSRAVKGGQLWDICVYALLRGGQRDGESAGAPGMQGQGAR